MLRLTAHPLQRIGAYALASIAEAERPTEHLPERPNGRDSGRQRLAPESLDAEGFQAAVAAMTADAVRAACIRDTKKVEGFFLKSSLSVFPNSPMNHPSNGKRSDEEIAERVTAWRSPPNEPVGVSCVLCGQPAAGFYGKLDVPLAESDAYRNTTPREHAGMALCWECVCCFHALPYGSHLTGGPCQALHSWDEVFLARTVAAQVRVTRQAVEIGGAAQVTLRSREVLALRALRTYHQPLTAGVELLVYGNNNRGPTLDVYALDQAMAEWLRRTATRAAVRRGFRALLRAHRSATQPGYVNLARNVFRAPERVPGTCANYLTKALARTPARTPARMPVNAPGPDGSGEELAALAALCFDYADKVMLMEIADLEEIRATGRRIATLFDENSTQGKLLGFYKRFGRGKAKDLRSWLQRESIDWVAAPGDGRPGPLITTRGFELLFDPDVDNRAWFHRQMLLVAVTEILATRGWRPTTSDDEAEIEETPELDSEDDEFANGGGEEEQ